jgi:glutamate-1-semialdehyde aminotransferase
MDKETRSLAENVIAQGSLTNSKRPQSFIDGVYPTHVVKGFGTTLWDTEGKKYQDFICGLGTNILGYGNSELCYVVEKAFRHGATLSLSSIDEIKLGQKIREIVPFVERIKILKTGSEGCTAAARIARAYNGKSLLLREGYSGWHDEMISLQPPALGVVGKFETKKLDGLNVEGASAVLMEPFITDISKERIEYLNRLRDECTKHKVVLIFDETITGLRFPKFTASQWSGVQPDMIIFGKALGGGMPISVVGGKAEIMNCGEYFVSSSFAGERVSISSALRCLELLQTKYMIEDLWESGKYFQQLFNAMELGCKIDGYPTRGVLKGEDLPKALFMQESCKAGLLFGASWFYAFPHMEQRDEIMATLKQIELKLKIGKVRLEGKLPQSPFAQKMRGTK